MGAMKEEMMRREALLEEATAIAVQAGVLTRCEYHADIVWDNFGEHEDAYRIANARYSAGEIRTPVESRRELPMRLRRQSSKPV